ncbi:MAG: DUF3459 domain-containing protein, partial [Anaerolineales bacterium]|nr:DUF3459 domain-containing protein [Anaerolineales bacterium]
PASMLSLVKQLLALRRGAAALHAGAYESLNEDADCFVYRRTAVDETFIIALNFTGEEQTTAVDASHLPMTAHVILSTHLDRTDGPVDLSAITLRPHEGVVLRVS